MANIALFPFKFADVPGVQCVFTTRLGGVSNEPFDASNLSFDVGDSAESVLENRESLQQTLGFRHWLEMVQVHGTEMHFDPKPAKISEAPMLKGDGAATTRKGVAIVIKTADCQPLMLAHRSGNFVAGLHVGWRGNVDKFPYTGTKRFLQTYKLNPRDVYAVRGPSLGPMKAEFTNFDEEFGPKFKQFRNRETGMVDLWALTRYQLLAAGLPEENIFGMDLCTNTMESTFYSYRADRTTGRQAGIIWMDA